MKPWHEDDAFWATWWPAMLSEESLERAPEEVGP